MTVKELIEILKGMPQDYEVWVDYGEDSIDIQDDYITQDYVEKIVWLL